MCFRMYFRCMSYIPWAVALYSCHRLACISMLALRPGEIFCCATHNNTPLRPDGTRSHPTSVKVSRRGWRPSAMAGSVDGQGRRESREGELRIVRSAIRALREAAETAQDQSVTFQLERAEEKE